MRTIKFKHKYFKLFDQKIARLVWYDLIQGREITDACMSLDASFQNDRGVIEIDRSWHDPKRKYFRLVFIGDNGVLFTTFRKLNRENFCRFAECEGKYYRIEVEGARHA